MVTVTNGIETFNVSSGAAKIYRDMGFEIIDSVEKHVKKVEEPKIELDGDMLFVNDIKEKPISQWTKEEIKRFANINNIDVDNVKTVKEAREVIKKFLS